MDFIAIMGYTVVILAIAILGMMMVQEDTWDEKMEEDRHDKSGHGTSEK